MWLLLPSLGQGTKATTKAGVIKYGPLAKMLCAVSLLVLLMLLPQVRSGDLKATAAAWRVPTFFGLVLIPILWEVIVRRVILLDNGFKVVSPWRRIRTIEWSEITGINYSARMHWHVIRTANRGEVHLSDLLSGKEPLLALAEAVICCSEIESGEAKFLAPTEANRGVKPPRPRWPWRR